MCAGEAVGGIIGTFRPRGLTCSAQAGDGEMERARNAENREGGGVHCTKAEGHAESVKTGRGVNDGG